nr:MAG TPA: hypothetical protein [Caudoviricetes sp.]
MRLSRCFGRGWAGFVKKVLLNFDFSSKQYMYINCRRQLD